VAAEPTGLLTTIFPQITAVLFLEVVEPSTNITMAALVSAEMAALAVAAGLELIDIKLRVMVATGATAAMVLFS
jgi:uncharacterized membrane protein YgaE (UPF0421/DUF939 family)